MNSGTASTIVILILLGGLGALAYWQRDKLRGNWGLIWMWVLTIVTFGYWIPALVGYIRERDGNPVNMGQVWVMNFFGFFPVLWIVALVFALKKQEAPVIVNNYPPDAATAPISRPPFPPAPPRDYRRQP